MRRPRVGLVHPTPTLGGGPEAITLQTIMALREDCELTLITYGNIELSAFNAFYGTDVAPEDVALIRVRPLPLSRGEAIKGYRLARRCQDLAPAFDVMFSLYNGMDFGRPGLQYIIDPNFTSELVQQLNSATRDRWFYRDTVFRRAYLKAGHWLARTSLEGLRRNVSLADSDWTGRMAHAHLGLECQTLYPPVPEGDGGRPWARRERGFVTVGRISPDKNLERVVDIVRKLRLALPETHLHIIGRVYDPPYGERLEAYCRSVGDWVHLERNVSAAKKAELIGGHRFGLHGKECEPFGIGVAEMVRSGCIVWVPSGGGQVEIVDHPQLVYSGVEDAVAKIGAVLGEPETQERIREHLERRARLFSVEKFRAEVRRLVLGFVRERGLPGVRAGVS